MNQEDEGCLYGLIFAMLLCGIPMIVIAVAICDLRTDYRKVHQKELAPPAEEVRGEVQVLVTGGGGGTRK